MRRFPALALVLVSVLSLLPGASRAAEPKKLKVVMVGVTGGEGFSAKQLGTMEELLLDAMHATPGLEVMGRADLATLIGFEQQKQLLGCEDNSCIAEIAGATGAQYVASADVGKLGTLTVLSLKVIDSHVAKVVARANRKLSADEQLPDASEELAREVFAIVRGEPVPPSKLAASAASASAAAAAPATGTTPASPDETSFLLLPAVGYRTDALGRGLGLDVSGAVGLGGFLLVPRLRYTPYAAYAGASNVTVGAELGYVLDQALISSLLPNVKLPTGGGTFGLKFAVLTGPAILRVGGSNTSVDGFDAAWSLRLLTLVEIKRLVFHVAAGGEWSFDSDVTAIALSAGAGWKF